jgi:plasmid segregation protein ParM
MANPVIRAIDLGYGGTKFTINDTTDGNLMCSIFPSVAALASDLDLTANGLTQKRDTVVVEVNGKHYEVGPDVLLANANRSNRNLHEDYIREDAYRALMYGALSFMNVDVIDMLVLGLPVRYLNTRQQELKEMFEGTHKVALDRMVTVKNVLVVAQPIGGFIDHAMRNDLFNQYKHETNLLIDQGFYTLDWMVAKGLKPIEQRCGGTRIGVSAMLKEIGKSLSKEVKRDIENINIIDEAVRNGYYRKGQSTIDMGHHLGQANALISEALSALFSSIDSDADINNIVLSGGGSFLIAQKIRERFPDHDVIVADNPVFANARGFQYAGELRMRGMSAKAA